MEASSSIDSLAASTWMATYDIQIGSLILDMVVHLIFGPRQWLPVLDLASASWEVVPARPVVLIPHLLPRQWLPVLDLASVSWEVAPAGLCGPLRLLPGQWVFMLGLVL